MIEVCVWGNDSHVDEEVGSGTGNKILVNLKL